MSSSQTSEPLPSLLISEWEATFTTLHMWTQIVGKIRLTLSPMTNHWWQVVLYLTARGLTTSPMPYGREAIQIDFDFIDQRLLVQSSRGEVQTIPLASRPVAAFYRELMGSLHGMGVDVQIWPVPVEVAERIPFDQDYTHTEYNPEYAHRYWRVLLQVDRVLKVFRGRFTGKASPVQFFWGGFDLATTRYSGRKAPPLDQANYVARYVMREAYSAEESSCGFWPGKELGQAAFYAYGYPVLPGYQDYPIQPAQAYYHKDLREYILPYESVRTSPDWDADVLAFLQTTYEGEAAVAKWDRDRLERP
jgi:hypothetical protein